MHCIELKGIQFYAYHGVMPQERIVGNNYTVDLKLFLDLTKPIDSDQVKDTINYAEVYDLLKSEMDIPSNLLEHAAGRMVKKLQATYPTVQSIELRLAKNNPPIEGDVKEAAVIIRTN